MGIAVNAMMFTFKIESPDGSSKSSLPSGHTATAFMTEEYLRQEYKEVSSWYGIARYTVEPVRGCLEFVTISFGLPMLWQA